MKKKDLQDLIYWMKETPGIRENIKHWETIEGKTAKYVSFPDRLHPKLRGALENRGITSLYSHQLEAFNYGMAGTDFTAVTPTASGKTLCYNLPVLQTILENREARALYMFPTKALSYDQKSELNELIDEADIQINSYYDGDTPVNIRQNTESRPYRNYNPDMPIRILPHHTKWVALFENLKFVIIRRIAYIPWCVRSHTANHPRLKRICRLRQRSGIHLYVGYHRQPEGIGRKFNR